MSRTDAEALKVKGNEHYKLGSFVAAIELYTAALALQPEEPVYLSNLSAAQLEDGQYLASLRSCDVALSLTEVKDSNYTALHSRLLSRRSKLLVFLHARAEGSVYLTNGAAACDTAIHNKPGNDLASIQAEALERSRSAKRWGMKVNQRLTDMPRYRQSLKYALEYFPVGHDTANSIFRHQKQASDKSTVSSERTNLLHMTVPRDGKSFHFAALFCGIGDARHMYASLADIGLDLSKFFQVQRNSIPDVKIHLTIIDIYPSILARNLIVLTLLHELSNIPKLFHATNPRALDLLLALHYVFWGTTMPPQAHEILQNTLEQVLSMVNAAVKQNEAINLTWLHIGSKTVREIHQRLNWWKTVGVNAVSFKDILPPRLESDNAPNKMTSNAVYERQAWKHLHVMVPPSHANEPGELGQVFGRIRSGVAAQQPSAKTLKSAYKQIAARWRINFTMIDKDWLDANYGKAVNLEHCPFFGVENFFSNAHLQHLRPAAKSGGVYEWSAVFFSHAADGLAQLRNCGDQGIKIEFIHGDGYKVMDQLNMSTIIREPTFPSTFDRVHASNVPDYVGGYLASFTTAIGLLKPKPTSYFACCSMTGVMSWEGDDSGSRLDSALYTYAGVTRSEISAAYGINLTCDAAPSGQYHTFGILGTPQKRLSRAQLSTVSYACFLKTVLPAKIDMNDIGAFIRELLNVHTFFRLMETFKNLGYAPHILADIVQSILDNNVNNSPKPHDVQPIPLSSRGEPLGVLCTEPFLADFEVAAVMWEPRLFPICSKFLPVADEIIRYSVRLELASIPMEHHLPTNFPVLIVVFGLPHDLDAGVQDLRERIGGTRHCHTSVQLVSTFEFDDTSRVATFLLSHWRAQQFITAGYEVALLNTMFWRIQSKKVKCASMVRVGDMDGWDESRKLGHPKGRLLTQNEVRGWEQDMSCMVRAVNPFLGMMAGSMPGMSDDLDEPPNIQDMLKFLGMSGREGLDGFY